MSPGLSFEIARDSVQVLGDPEQHRDEIERQLGGPVVALQRHLQRDYVLHASALHDNSTAIGIVGASGWGKSTTAAALRAATELRFLTDDVLAVDWRQSPPIAHAGPTHVRLWPDAAGHLGESWEGWAKVHEAMDKRVTHLEPSANDVPLAHLFILDPQAAEPAIRPLTGAEAIAELLRHAFTAPALALRAEPWHLEAVTAIARQVRVHLLGVPRSFDHLDDVVALVEEQRHA